MCEVASSLGLLHGPAREVAPSLGAALWAPTPASNLPPFTSLPGPLRAVDGPGVHPWLRLNLRLGPWSAPVTWLSTKNRYPTWMGVPHIVLCTNGWQRMGGPNNHKKNMCRLESSGDWIGQSPKVYSWVLKATLFFKSFLFRTPRAHCGTLVLFVKSKVHI